jgi:myo-inositol-1(or 4)-monophosphatase
VAGKPSTCNGTRITVTNENHEASGLHIAAFGINNDMQSVAGRMGDAITALLNEGWVTRQTGAATIDICRVATGSWCGFFEYGLQYWDFAAAALIAEQAGCTVVAKPVRANPDDNPLDFDLIVARDKDMAAALGKALKIDVAETVRR